jgi:hypothetical protein
MITPFEVLNAALKRKGVKPDEINIVISAPLGYGASSVQVAIYNFLKEAGVNVKMKQARLLVPAYRGKKIANIVPVHIVRIP